MSGAVKKDEMDGAFSTYEGVINTYWIYFFIFFLILKMEAIDWP
jgi:hypothetical protein